MRATMRSFADRTQPTAAPTARPSSAPPSHSPDGGSRSFPASETTKKTLMRRFEGLFDKSVKKRGAALIVLVALLTATLGGTIAVGTKKDPAAVEARALLMANTFAQAYVDEDAAAYMKYLAPDSDLAKYDDYFSTGAAVYRRYVTRYDPRNRDRAHRFRVRVGRGPRGCNGRPCAVARRSVPQAMRLHFTGKGSDMLISSMTFEVSSDPFTSDPDNNYLAPRSTTSSCCTQMTSVCRISSRLPTDRTIGSGDPTQAAETLLGLSGGQPAERHRQRCPRHHQGNVHLPRQQQGSS